METSKSFSVSDLDDLVFINRNRGYGAYELRKNYEKRFSIGLLSSLAGALLLILFFNNLPDKENKAFMPAKPKKWDSSVVLHLRPEIITEGPHQPQKKSTGLGRIILTDTKQADIDTERIDHINGTEGEIGGIANAADDMDEGMGLPGPARTVEPINKKKTYDMFPDRNAEYPGGEAAMENYLHKNIKYPNFAVENGIEGLIYLSLEIDETGAVDNVTVLKGIGGGCDEAAVNAVKNMPRWRPGRKNGANIPVIANLKVRMILN